jgi:hypothetical protein
MLLLLSIGGLRSRDVFFLAGFTAERIIIADNSSLTAVDTGGFHNNVPPF